MYSFGAPLLETRLTLSPYVENTLNEQFNPSIVLRTQVCVVSPRGAGAHHTFNVLTRERKAILDSRGRCSANLCFDSPGVGLDRHCWSDSSLPDRYLSAAVPKCWILSQTQLGLILSSFELEARINLVFRISIQPGLQTIVCYYRNTCLTSIEP